MAANRFATLLHRNTNKLAVIVVYTALEWTLIALLLLNALLSYLTNKFAAFFGLKPPCIFCSRVDHVLEPGKSYRDLLCAAHAAEVSRLCYCSHHRKLAEASDMCEGCASSRPVEADRAVAVLSWMKRSEAGEKDLRCSCCDVILESEFYSPFLVLKSSWGVLEITQKGNSAKEGLEEVLEGPDEGENFSREVEEEDRVVSVSPDGGCRNLEGEVEKDGEQAKGEGENGAAISEQDLKAEALVPSSDPRVAVEDDSLDAVSLRSDNIFDEGRLVSVELIDVSTLAEKFVASAPGGEDKEELEHNSFERDSAEPITSSVSIVAVSLRSDNIFDEGHLVSVELIDVTTLAEKFVASAPGGEDEEELEHNSFERDSAEPITSSVSIVEIKDTGCCQILEMVHDVEEDPWVPPAEESGVDCYDDYQCVMPEAMAEISQGLVDIKVEALAAAEDSGEVQDSEDDSKAMDGEANCEISIGSEICDQEQIDQSHFHETISMPVGVEVRCSENYDKITHKDLVIDRLSICPELNEVEEERTPETPTSIEEIHALHRRFFFERRESGTESLDESVGSEIEGSEALTMDGLKSALRAERKALSALYAELEEERSASAIAANQTMAMITRLQQEKAAMQMEALQYQRMMEEQSEYDQEALQLLNELMMKREKEKQDLTKKVLLYEAKERRRMMARSKADGRSETSSASSSGAEDSDGLSFDFHEGNECFGSLNESNQDSPTDSGLSSGALPESAKHLLTLDESLSDFEEERISILEQLKVLEEKLFTLDVEEPSNDLEPPEHFPEENGHGLNGDYEALGNYVNSIVNGLSIDPDTNGKHCERRIMGCRGKQLLPLFDAISMENEDRSPEPVSKLAIDPKKLAIAEEVDNVYERLQALEADREFLKHCISSLKKGDKGMDLLQEILQHLRDLRNVELRVRNAGDALATLSD